MAQARKQKESIVEELKKLFEKASILVFVNFHGLSVAKERKLRGEFRKNEIKYNPRSYIMRWKRYADGARRLTEAHV